MPNPPSERLFELFFARQVARYANLPGPRPRGLLGNARDFMGDRTAWEVCADYADRYGDQPVLWLSGKPVMVLNDPHSIQDVLDDTSGVFDKTSPVKELLPVTTETSVFTATQKTGWREKRAGHPFSHTWAKKWYQSQIGPLRDLLTERIERHLVKPAKEPWLELLPLLRRWSFDAFAVAAVGRPLGGDAWRDFMALARTGDRRIKMPAVLTPPLAPSFYRHRRSFYGRFVECVRATRRADDPQRVDLLATMLRQGAPQDDLAIARILGLMFFGGLFSASAALLASLHALARYPDEAERLRGAVDALTRDSEYDASALAARPRIEAVLREAMRLWPPVPLFTREVMAEHPVKVGRYEVPPGTTLWITNAHAHRDPDRYRDPQLFRPDRWIESGLGVGLEKNPIGSGWFFPFGRGPRMCLGSQFAMLYLQVALTTLVEHTTVSFQSTEPYAQSLFFGVVQARDVRARITARPPADKGHEPRELADRGERPPLADGLPWLGSAVDYLRRPLDFFTDATARHGPVFRMRMLGQDIVVISASEGAGLISAPGEGCPLTRKGLFRAFATETSVDMFGADGEQHAQLRKMVRLGYSRHVGAQFVPDMVEVTRRALRSWRPGREFELLRRAEEISLQCIMTAVTPIDLSGELEAVRRLGEDVMYVTMGLRPNAVLQLPGYTAARGRVDAAVDAAIARHKAGEFGDSDRMHMIDALLTTKGEDGKPLGARGVRGSAIYALCGTQLYIGRLVTFMLYELLRNQQLLQDVQREVDAAFALGPLNADVFRRMRSLRGVYIETLRMYPLVSGLLFRAARDFVVSGYRVQADDTILVTSVADHYNPQVHTDPFHFDVGRGANRRQVQQPGSFSPFGLRPRVCAAAGLVEVVTLTVTTTILHTVRLGLVRPSQRPSLALRPLLCPADGMPLSVESVRSDLDRIIDPSALAIDCEDDPFLVEHSESLSSFDVEAIHVAPGDDIVREGEAPDWFYVIIQGTADVYQSQEDGASAWVASLTQGQIFGEIGLLKGSPRNATVRARDTMGLLRLNRDTFLTLVAESDLLGQELGRLLQRRFMRKAIAEALPRLPGQLAQNAMEGVQLRQYGAGEVIIRQGEPAEHFFILAAGEAEVVADDSHGDERLLTTLQRGAAFGEIGILTRRPRTATVRVSAKGPAVTMRLDRDRFEAVVAESPDATADLALIIQRRILRHLETLGQLDEH